MGLHRTLSCKTRFQGTVIIKLSESQRNPTCITFFIYNVEDVVNFYLVKCVILPISSIFSASGTCRSFFSGNPQLKMITFPFLISQSHAPLSI